MESNEVSTKPQETVDAPPTPLTNPNQAVKKEPGVLKAILAAVVAAIIIFAIAIFIGAIYFLYNFHPTFG